MNEDKDLETSLHDGNLSDNMGAEETAGAGPEEVCDEHIEAALAEEIKESFEAVPTADSREKSENIEPSSDSVRAEDPAQGQPIEAFAENSKPMDEQAHPYSPNIGDTQNIYTQNPGDTQNIYTYNPNGANQNVYRQNGYQVPPNQPYQNNNGWQAPPQQPSQQSPQQQTQWTFNDYGPMQQQAPQNKQKPPKKPKKDKNPHSSNFGIKIFAGVISVMFILTATAFAGYVIYDMNKNSSTTIENDVGNSQSKPENDTGKPSLNVGQTPDKGADTNNDGVLSGREINEKVSPSVVGVAVYAKTTGFQLAGQGSGIIMTKDGYVITNAHVVSDQTNQVKIEKIEVILSDGNTHDAKLIGLDIKTDIAVLKISAENLVPAEFGDSEKLQIGDDVFVIGNPSGIEFAGSFTKGTVSSLSRSIYMQQLGAEIEYIQTDAAINPGNSGGAFINEYGQVVGISSAKISFEGYEGMGFAIPINNAKDIIDSLIANGYVAGRPKIGIGYSEIGKTIAELNGIPHGLRVGTVEEGFDAYKKGVKVGDIIFKMDGKEVYDAVTIAKALEDKKPGDTLVLTIYRVDESGRSSTFDISVVLGEMTE